jgi:hypothetical protein
MPQTLNDVPLSGQTLGITQPLIRGNFTTIDTAFQVDHVAYSTSGQGKHNKVTFPVQTVVPGVVGGEIVLYNKNYATTGRNELWVTDPFDASDTPMTASSGNSQNGYTYFPSGAFLQYGFGSALANTSTTINFPTNYASAPFSITVTEQSSGGSTPAPTLTIGAPLGSPGTGFIVKNSGSATNFYWMAIGR